MKIILIDEVIQNKIRIYHDPQEIVLKPKRRIVKIIEDCLITEYKLVSYKMTENCDKELDIVEYILSIFIDGNFKPMVRDGSNS